ncbi:hypothetical protein NGH92_03770 [Staphylococcus succinus]|uniref:hypothetical protein n=1 Tax=Staphylococcus succinus TaxID=61015 RepID=UPI002DBB355A|nr:hypothetical protein [Staphylococcus succinus]MEB8123933.1 hypothetical protein [Staphylococcus succinus]
MNDTNNIERAKAWIEHADAILITASNGLSISEGYHIFANNNDFKEKFKLFNEQLGIQNIVQGLFYNYPSEGMRILFYQTLIKYMITDYSGSSVFYNLKKIIGTKDYFILTSNGDTHFQINKFDKDKIFEIEGNFYNGLYRDFKSIENQQLLFKQFLETYRNKKLVILELGIGKQNTLIKAPIMDLVYNEAFYRYITFNLPQEIYINKNIENQSIAIEGEINKTLKELLK